MELLRHAKGASIAEMVKATGWQTHSVRGVISGVLKKRLGLTITSTNEERGRVYRVAGSRLARSFPHEASHPGERRRADAGAVAARR